MQIHWGALTSETQELYHLLAKIPFISEFYLGGGTGLALQIGHRHSIDLDFFSDSSLAVGIKQRQIILETIKSDPSLKLTWDKDGTFAAVWRNVGLSFFRLDQHPLIKPPILVHEIQIATIEEIGAMKLAAILSRGTRKDYIDLYFILQHKNLKQLFKVAAKKYPYNAAFPTFAIRALSYFHDAESDPMPRMIIPVKWKELKTFLDNQALAAGREQLELEKLWKINYFDK